MLAITKIGGETDFITPVFRSQLTDRNSDVREAAIRAIGSSGWDCVPTLLELLRHENEETRLAAARAIENVAFSFFSLTDAAADPERSGPLDVPDDAKLAVEALIDSLADPSHLVRAASAEALYHFDFDAFDSGVLEKKAALKLIVVALNDKEEAVRREAACALGSFQREPTIVIPALTKALSDKSSSVRSEAVDALGAFRSAARTAIPALEGLLSTEKEQGVRKHITEALKEMQGENADDGQQELTHHVPDSRRGRRSARAHQSACSLCA
jgi:HEAT repeat protein